MQAVYILVREGKLYFGTILISVALCFVPGEPPEPIHITHNLVKW